MDKEISQELKSNIIYFRNKSGRYFLFPFPSFHHSDVCISPDSYPNHWKLRRLDAYYISLSPFSRFANTNPSATYLSTLLTRLIIEDPLQNKSVKA